VSFEFFDGTNIGPGDGHMQHVTFSVPDADHHVEEWTYLDHGKEMKEAFTYERRSRAATAGNDWTDGAFPLRFMWR